MMIDASRMAIVSLKYLDVGPVRQKHAQPVDAHAPSARGGQAVFEGFAEHLHHHHQHAQSSCMPFAIRTLLAIFG